MISLIEIKTRIESNIITASLEVEDGTQEGDMFYTYLLKDGVVFFRSNDWSRSPVLEWRISESGSYAVQAHVRRNGVNTVSFSAPIFFMDDHDLRIYEAWMRLPAENINEINVESVFRPAYPYNDFVVLTGAKSCDFDKKWKIFAQRFDLDIVAPENFKNTFIFSSSGHIKQTNHNLCIFSGSCFFDNRLIFGDRDLENIDLILKSEPVGNYSYLATINDAKKIVCGADYFGIHKIFYLKTEEISLISTNYHLLLLLARYAGAPLEIDKDKVEANLVFATLQPFHQNFTRHMDVKSVQMLPADKMIEVDSEGRIFLRETSLAAALAKPQSFDDCAYEALMLQAKKEILSNVKAVLNHPAFENVICDLSGGMDSRLVFSALTHFPEYAQKVRINSHYSAEEPDDLVVAQEIASFYRFAYDDLPREQAFIDKTLIASDSWSYNLGVYYSYTPISRISRIQRTARLNGFYGEICARPYYSRKMFNTALDVESIEDFCDYYFSRHQKSAVGGSVFAIDKLKKYFSNELSCLPGRTALEKFDNHYMFYRNGLHCSDRFRNSISCPEFGPIQSKALSAAKAMGYQNFCGAKTQFDIINLLNPVLASYRYESPYDNNERAATIDQFGIVGEQWFKDLKITAGNVANEWKSAKNRIKFTEINIDSEINNKLIERYRNFHTDHFSLAHKFLKELWSTRIVCDEKLIREIWFIFSEKNKKSSSLKWNILNRLASIYMQSKIVNGRNLDNIVRDTSE